MDVDGQVASLTSRVFSDILLGSVAANICGSVHRQIARVANCRQIIGTPHRANLVRRSKTGFAWTALNARP